MILKENFTLWNGVEIPKLGVPQLGIRCILHLEPIEHYGEASVFPVYGKNNFIFVSGMTGLRLINL